MSFSRRERTKRFLSKATKRVAHLGSPHLDSDESLNLLDVPSPEVTLDRDNLIDLALADCWVSSGDEE